MKHGRGRAQGRQPSALLMPTAAGHSPADTPPTPLALALRKHVRTPMYVHVHAYYFTSRQVELQYFASLGGRGGLHGNDKAPFTPPKYDDVYSACSSATKQGVLDKSTPKLWQGYNDVAVHPRRQTVFSASRKTTLHITIELPYSLNAVHLSSWHPLSRTFCDCESRPKLV